MCIAEGNNSGYLSSRRPAVDSMTNRRPVDDAMTVSRPRLDLSMSASVGDDNRYAGDSAVFCHIHIQTHIHTQSPQL